MSLYQLFPRWFTAAPVATGLLLTSGCTTANNSSRPQITEQDIRAVERSRDYTKLTAAQKAAWEAEFDKQSIRHSAALRSDVSRQFLVVPESLVKAEAKGLFSVASSPPLVDFGVVQGLEPEYGDGQTWGGWGDVTRGPRGAFYFSIGNHRERQADAFILKYNPAAAKQEVLFHTKDIIGWDDDEYGDSKVHGYLDVAPDGTLYGLTLETLAYGARLPEELWEAGYRGSWMFRCNVFSGVAENLGVPVVGRSWPYHIYDWQRNMVFAVSRNTSRGTTVFAYDTEAEKTRYAGVATRGINWYDRCTMLDRDTGLIYSTDLPVGWDKRNPAPETEHRFVVYDPERNEFRQMQAAVPKHPIRGVSAPIRAHTQRKDRNGAFWCFDVFGTFFRFYPEDDRTELVGVNWLESGRYVANMCMSPDGRYIYYVMDSGTDSWQYGTPVVQYDTVQRRRKIIAFLHDFYLDKYGYSPGGTYGVEMDRKGESLFFYVNGRFRGPSKRGGYGRPAIYHVHIPASER